jgi:ELWxxDGT repeat protein
MRRLAGLATACTIAVVTPLLATQPAAAVPFGPEPTLLRDINPGDGNAYVEDFGRVGNTLVFGANDGAHGTELWASDGTPGGTRMVKDLNPAGDSAPVGFTSFAGKLYFSAHDAAHGRELWVTDGTPAGTRLVKDIVPLADGSVPDSLTVAAGRLWFTAYTQVDGVGNGRELWSSDGTAAGTALFKEINPGGPGSNPSRFTPSAGKLFFTATTATSGEELWVSDGTVAGTKLVTEIGPDSGGAAIQELHATPTGVFLTALDPAHGFELWTSDGTAAGTSLVKDLWVGTGSGLPRGYTDFGGFTYFTATGNVAGVSDGAELWRTDGTEQGTTLVKDVWVGTNGANPTALTVLGNRLYFSASDGVVIRGLYRTDGTAAGTGLVQDLSPGGDSLFGQATTHNGRLYFLAQTAQTGVELWTSDGTAAATRPLVDLGPGLDGQALGMPFRLDNTLVWPGATTRLGYEVYLWNTQASTTTVTPARAYSRKQGRRLRIKVPVAVTGASGLTGTVTLWKGSTRLGTATVVGGKAVVRIGVRLKPGKHQVRATYAGSWKARASTSRVVIVKVRRR